MYGIGGELLAVARDYFIYKDPPPANYREQLSHTSHTHVSHFWGEGGIVWVHSSRHHRDRNNITASIYMYVCKLVRSFRECGLEMLNTGRFISKGILQLYSEPSFCMAEIVNIQKSYFHHKRAHITQWHACEVETFYSHSMSVFTLRTHMKHTHRVHNQRIDY